MIYAIGDVHGELRKLHRLLQLVEAEGLRPDDRLVFVGDYVDRGKESCGVIELLLRLGEQRPNTVFLRGNHDQVMMDARDLFDKSRGSSKSFEDVNWWFSCGGRDTIDSYGGTGAWWTRVPDEHWQFLERTTLEYREGPYAFVHAGLVPPDKVWRNVEDPRMWIREPFIDSLADFGAIVVFGHTPQSIGMPVVMRNKIGIDTGAAYGWPLTAVVLDPSKPYDSEKVRFIQAS